MYASFNKEKLTKSLLDDSHVTSTRPYVPYLQKYQSHYENTPMQYIENFFGCKNEDFHWKNFDFFLIFAQNIDCGYRRGGSNEYPQSMFCSKNKKNRCTPAYPSFTK